MIVPRGVAIAATGAGILVGLWAAVLTWSMFGDDDLARRFVTRESELQATYEHRVNALRARADRAASEVAREAEGLEAKVRELAARQRHLEERQEAFGQLAGQVARLGLDKREGKAALPWSSTPQARIDPAAPLSFAPSAAPAGPESFGLRGGEREVQPTPPKGPRPLPESLSSLPVAHRLALLERGLDRASRADARALDEMLAGSRRESARLRGVLASVGFDPDLKTPKAGGVGGPLVPVPAASTGTARTDAELDLLRSSLADLERLTRYSNALPLGRPTPAETEITSGFGYRFDPFTRSPALHTGLDLKAEWGTPVRATAAGRVVSAELTGGYGYMVEIDHGYGFVTRYAHLSSFEVAPGDPVSAGSVIGRAGSTGRSTGAHLHYETRIEGEPVDPRRFLTARSLLSADAGVR